MVEWVPQRVPEKKRRDELKDTPLRDLAHLGGSKDTSTLLSCYQLPDEATQRRPLEQPDAPYERTWLRVGTNGHQERTQQANWRE
jgi:hypothetical protein